MVSYLNGERLTHAQADEVEEQLEKGTVALNSAGFFIQPLAVICEALLEALQLPVWLNIYITAAGKAKSAPAHTDKQDVIAIQTEGSKRWRVFRPPPTADKVCEPCLFPKRFASHELLAYAWSVQVEEMDVGVDQPGKGTVARSTALASSFSWRRWMRGWIKGTRFRQHHHAYLSSKRPAHSLWWD